jgi:hypothetical protein
MMMLVDIPPAQTSSTFMYPSIRNYLEPLTAGLNSDTHLPSISFLFVEENEFLD